MTRSAMPNRAPRSPKGFWRPLTTISIRPPRSQNSTGWLIPPLLGMLFSVAITELLPMLGLPALTAPFVLATWLVLALGWLDGKLFREPAPKAS